MEPFLSRLRAPLRLETILGGFSSAVSELPCSAPRDPRASYHWLCRLEMISLWVCSTILEPFEGRSRYLRASQRGWHPTESWNGQNFARGLKKPRKPACSELRWTPGHNMDFPGKSTNVPSSESDELRLVLVCLWQTWNLGEIRLNHREPV